jgi:shikimate kinase
MGNFELPLREKTIVFVGFMGVGKTTIGKLVAKKLYRDFVDADEEIEKEFDMPTTKIFETYGEKTFREKEQSLIVRLSEQPLKVVSLGGGAFLNETIRKACLNNCLVIYLDLSFDNWKERMGLLIDSRPILQDKSLEQMEELFYSRQPAYALHNSKVVTDHLHPEEVADYIVESLKLAWELHS